MPKLSFKQQPELFFTEEATPMTKPAKKKKKKKKSRQVLAMNDTMLKGSKRSNQDYFSLKMQPTLLDFKTPVHINEEFTPLRVKSESRD